MPHVSRFKKRTSDRSGFDYPERELVKDKGLWVHPDELDTPPPSKRSLGGEGDVSGEPRANSTFTVANLTTTIGSLDNPTVYITAAGGVSPSYTFPWMRIVGSNNAITVTASPPIVAGQQGNLLVLQCVGSSVTLNNGAGLSTLRSSPLVLTSGMAVSLFYSTANNAWNETSRFRA